MTSKMDFRFLSQFQIYPMYYPVRYYPTVAVGHASDFRLIYSTIEMIKILSKNRKWLSCMYSLLLQQA